MKMARPKTEKYHNYEEGDCGFPIENYYKKGLLEEGKYLIEINW